MKILHILSEFQKTVRELLIEKSSIIFLIIPIVYIFSSLLPHNAYGEFYQKNTDPEYFHAFNGIAIANGNLNVSYTAHPGTPVQFIIALSSRVIYLFHSSENITQDFIDNPEVYIQGANLFIILLVAIVLYFAGLKLYRYSSRYIYGLIIQLGILSNSSLVGISGRVMPEPVMLIPLIFLMVYVLRDLLISEDKSETNKKLIIYALMIAFGIACKLSFIPLVLFPILYLKLKFPDIIKYIVYLSVSFLIFAYPAFINIKSFGGWVFGIFSKSGQWGGGDKAFIDLSTIPANAKYLFSSDKGLFIISLISLIIVLLSFVKPLRKRLVINDKVVRAMFALNMVLILIVVLTLKHFALHYFMPFYIFKFFLILLMLMFFSNLLKNRLSRKIFTVLTFTIVLIISFGQVKAIKAANERMKQNSEAREEVSITINSLINKGCPLIYTAPYYGAPFPEYALSCGLMMSYDQKKIFKDDLKNSYPLSFHYVDWSEAFYYWGDFVDMEYIASKFSSLLYIYSGPGKLKDLESIDKRICEYYKDSMPRVKTLFFDKKTGEKLIEYKLGEYPVLLQPSIDSSINIIITSIKNDSGWFDKIKAKAEQNSISIDEQLMLDAEWVINNQ